MNTGNIFITKENKIKICDFDLWRKFDDVHQCARELLLNPMAIIRHLLNCSTLKVKEPNHILFSHKLDEDFFQVSKETIEGFYNKSWPFGWEKVVKEKMSTMDHQQIEYLPAYIDAVLKMMSNL